MALKVLPNDVRSLLSASAQINNYLTAIEELVYNSLDAESTCIAIRIHIQENRMQVIDNGYGITKNDFDVLGQRYMTSKLTDLSSLKSMPKCYGYRGEFLSNIIEVSENVKIISRFKDGVETWAKTFNGSKKKQITKMTIRPSKGTTVEIKGFLYNLKIKKQGIDPVNELHNIKTFLEQLSLVHNNVSISLRNDYKNDIIFKIHKKRNLYQTLSTLFGIEKNLVQELQIEKNQYKVKALIGKTDIETGKHWVYLNGKFIQSKSKLHVIINEYLKKYLLITDKNVSKTNNHVENHLFKSSLPFYFLFITCPYMDYDISSTLRKTVIEFKNWEQMKIMLEKLIKFYIGDVNLQEKKPEQQAITIQEINKVNKDTTRYEVKKIIAKILGSNSKKMGALLQNGVKGKRIKRKHKNNNKNVKINDLFQKIGSKSYLNQNKSLQNIRFNDNCKDFIQVAAKENTCNNDKSIVQEGQHILNTPNINKIESLVATLNIKTSKIKKHKRANYKKIRNVSSGKAMNQSHKNKYNPKINRNKSKKTKNNSHRLNVPHIPKKTDVLPTQSKIIPQEVKKNLRYQNDYLNSKSRYNTFANFNKCIIDKMMNKIQVKPYKTTYDLVQSVFNSELDNKCSHNNRLSINFRDYPIVDLMETSTKLPLNPRLSIDYTQDKLEHNSMRRRSPISYTLTYENTYVASSKVSKQCEINDLCNYQSIPVESTQQSLRCADILREKSVFDTQKKSSFDLTYEPGVSALTYESHQYNHYDCNLIGNSLNTSDIMEKQINKSKKTRFITKQSRDNFHTTDKIYSYKYFYKTREVEMPLIKQSKHYSKYIKQTTDESYTIEFTKSNEIMGSARLDEQYDYRHYNENTYTILDDNSPNYEPISGFGHTYTIPTYSSLSDCNKTSNDVVRSISNELFVSDSIRDKNMEEDIHDLVNTTINVCSQDKHSPKIIFISQPQNSNDVVNMDEDTIQPINLCETVFHENGSIEKEFAFSFNRNSRLDDSLYDNFSNIHPINRNSDKYITQVIQHRNNNEESSYHFGNTGIVNQVDEVHNGNTLDTTEVTHISNKKYNIEIPSTHNSQKDVVRCNKNNEKLLLNIGDVNFNFKSRLRFLPKGMSQIFEKCGSKTVCDYNLDEDYYEDIIYNDFATDVQMHTEIYEPVIQNVEDLTTKDIYKFKNKVQKDVASLVFDQKSLKDAEVLNQVDCKFIAVVMKEKKREQDTMSEYLVLLDQHAVHERIRLEKNLADYFNKDQWKSVPIDNITMKLSKDEIVYLHNYKDKFNQLGIQWFLLNNDEVLVSSIPEAVLGKNPREVEKVIKAIKNIIVEEINVIKLQKGCISMYPKSIMGLVFSEACRYAIKFGDKLSKNDCINLLNDLSNCKTPFQCAHGRPVMAVLVDIKRDKREYKIDMASLRKYKLNRKTDAKIV